MTQKRSIVGLFVLIAIGLVAFSGPAAAEFFGCHDTRGKVLYSRTIVTYPDRYYGSQSRYTYEYAARPVHRRHARVYYSPRHYDGRYYSNDRW